MAIAAEEARPAPRSLLRSRAAASPLGHSCHSAFSCAGRRSWSLFFFSFSHLQSKFVYCNFFFFFVNYLP